MKVSRVLTGPFPLRFSARPHCPYGHVLAASRGRSPACASAQTNRRCGPKRMLSLLLVHPTASPGSPWLPPVACPPTSPRAGRATDALAGWLPAPSLAEAWYNPAERQSRPKKWAAMFGNLFTLPIRCGLPHGLAPAPGIGDAAARRTRSQGRFRLVKILHAGVTGRGTAPRGDRGRCRGWRCTGQSRNRPSWGQGEWLSAERLGGRGAAFWGAARRHAAGEAVPARRVRKGLRGEGLEPPHTARCRPGRYLAPAGQGTLLGRPGRHGGDTHRPGTCPSLPLRVQRRCSPLLPPRYGQGSIQEALNSSRFFPVG